MILGAPRRPVTPAGEIAPGISLLEIAKWSTDRLEALIRREVVLAPLPRNTNNERQA